MKIEIKKWTNDEVLFSLDIENNSIKLTVEAAVKAGVSLSYANLYSANLVRANLVRANLVRANLYSANLYSANLYSANLYSANLVRANLYSANLDSANLDSANLDSANLVRANLDSANLDSANLDSANLVRANLVRANLDSANLYSANLDSANLNGAKYGDFTIKKLPIQISNIGYYVLIFETHMKIGCELHTHDEWKNFTNREIAEMDGKKALAFWKQYKSLLVGFCKTMEEKKIKKKESNNE